MLYFGHWWFFSTPRNLCLESENLTSLAVSPFSNGPSGNPELPRFVVLVLIVWYPPESRTSGTTKVLSDLSAACYRTIWRHWWPIRIFYSDHFEISLFLPQTQDIIRASGYWYHFCDNNSIINNNKIMKMIIKCDMKNQIAQVGKLSIMFF